MRYTRFEDLPIWQLAVSLYERAHALALRNSALGVVFQQELERTSLAISTEIAESFERGATSAMLHHIENARALTAGLRSLIGILEQRKHAPETALQLAELRDGLESCTRQLRAWFEMVRKAGLEDEAGEQPAPSPGRLKSLLENLPPGHSLRSDPTP